MYQVNLPAVLVAAVIPMIVGALWYGPLFGKRWLALMETTEEEIAKDFNPWKTYGVSFLLALVTAYVLAQLLSMPGDGGAVTGVQITVLVVIGFVLPLQYQAVAFEKRKPGLMALTLGYNFAALLGQAILLAVWI